MMTFDNALSAMFQGLRFARLSWTSGVYIYYDGSTIQVYNTLLTPTLQPWTPLLADIVASDWSVVR